MGTGPGTTYLGRALIEASRSAARSKNTYFAAQYQRIASRRGPNKAAVAVAHSMVIAAWHVLTTGEPYEDLGADYFARPRDPEREIDRLVRGLMDRGYRVWYAADLVARHPMPVAAPARHGYSRYYGARNRVWVARRHLPLPLAVVYVASFAARTLPLLLRSPGDIRPALRGYLDGMRQPCGQGRKLRLRTLLRMARAGRPPIV